MSELQQLVAQFEAYAQIKGVLRFGPIFDKAASDCYRRDMASIISWTARRIDIVDKEEVAAAARRHHRRGISGLFMDRTEPIQVEKRTRVVLNTVLYSFAAILVVATCTHPILTVTSAAIAVVLYSFLVATLHGISDWCGVH
jgi:hypothetical protein